LWIRKASTASPISGVAVPVGFHGNWIPDQ
jgi:hypothetical protein